MLPTVPAVLTVPSRRCSFFSSSSTLSPLTVVDAASVPAILHAAPTAAPVLVRSVAEKGYTQKVHTRQHKQESNAGGDKDEDKTLSHSPQTLLPTSGYP